MAAYGTGSDLQRGIQAATAALQGLAGGDIAGALAGASAPELANLIGHGSGLSDGAAVVAHAILGGAVAALQGNSAAAGAAGAAAGELAARAIAGMLYPGVTDLSTLTEAQKQTVSTLATISAGMAGGLAGDSTASAVAGAQGGKNAVENNSLSKDKIFDINPMLKIGIEGADGDPLKGGGGIGKGTPKVPSKLQPFTNPAQGPVIPQGWVSKPGRTPGSTIYYPPNTDPGSPGSTYIRVMPSGSTPVPGLENGYWISVKNGQPINPATGGTGTRGETHVPLPTDTMPPKR
ncbi:VENN motif pre-toxin domain-containing protein [Klebsiella variicola subsp. variicola]